MRLTATLWKMGIFLALLARLARQAFHPEEEHHQRRHGADALGNQRGPGDAGHTHVKPDDEQQIQYDVGEAGDHQKDQRRFAVTLGIVNTVQGVVEEEKDRAAEVDSQISLGVGHDVRVRAQQLQQRPGKNGAQCHQDQS